MPSERRQRQKAQEQAKREAAKKAESRKELIRRLWIALGLGAGVVLLLLASNLFAGGEPSQPSAYLAFRDQDTACGAEAPDEQTTERFEPADQGLNAPVTAVVATSCGDFTMVLDPAMAPESVNAFVFLAREGAYDGTVFHHSSLWVQAGDPEANGGGTLLDGYRPPDEFPDEDFEVSRGTVGLVGDRATRGSAFFAVVAEDAPLSARVNVMGEVTDGFDTLDAIAGIEARGDRPVETVYIEGITIE